MTHPATVLSVNLNKIALIRNSRPGNYPDVISFGQTCIAAGAGGLTVHPRPDQRHIRPSDVYGISKLVKSHSGIEFNIEGNPFAEKIGDFPGFLQLVDDTRPEQCTLVPDTNSQLTSDHGFDLTKTADELAPVIEKLKAWGVRVSLFMDPDIQQISLAKALGVERIELYTGPYADAHKNQSANLEELFHTYKNAAIHAHSIGLGVNAGHDLNLENLPMFRQIPNILEVSIGHALVVDALNMGIVNSVKAYKAACAS